MAIIVLQHDPHCAPARLGATLRDHAFRLDVRRLDLSGDEARDHATRTSSGTGVPTDFDGVDAVISLGGQANVGEPHPWMEPEVEFLREAHRRQLPLIGICLGHQLIAHALGGEVAPMQRPEWGLLPVTQLPPANTDIILAGIPWSTYQFQAHSQEVKTPPPDATVLMSSPACRVQAFRAGLRTYAFQFHFEVDRPLIATYAKADAPTLAKLALTDSDVSAQCDRHYDDFARSADRLCVNLATCMFPSVSRLRA